jgi:hypothetical protein
MPSKLCTICIFGLLQAPLACVTVKPMQRAILADPLMRFDGESEAAAKARHAVENREGTYGGEGVSGGGCGCN